MAKSCSFRFCKNNSRKSKCRFFKFPSYSRNLERRRLWTIRCGRKIASGAVWEPKPGSQYVYVCSDHFITGEPCNYKTHPDYAPSLRNIEERSSVRSKQALLRFSRSLVRSANAISYSLKLGSKKQQSLSVECTAFAIASSQSQQQTTFLPVCHSDVTPGEPHETSQQFTSLYDEAAIKFEPTNVVVISPDLDYKQPGCDNASYGMVDGGINDTITDEVRIKQDHNYSLQPEFEVYPAIKDEPSGVVEIKPEPDYDTIWKQKESEMYRTMDDNDGMNREPLDVSDVKAVVTDDQVHCCHHAENIISCTSTEGDEILSADQIFVAYQLVPVVIQYYVNTTALSSSLS